MPTLHLWANLMRALDDGGAKVRNLSTILQCDVRARWITLISDPKAAGAAQRRLAPGVLNSGLGNTGSYAGQQINQFNLQKLQPYILHTCDEYSSAPVASPGGATVHAPSHAIAFRTVDVTVTLNSSGNDYIYPYGGGKLGMYNWWNLQLSCLPTNPPTQPPTPSPSTPLYPQYELYTYPANFAELGNEAVSSVAAPSTGTHLQSGQSTLGNPGNPYTYSSAFGSIASGELYAQYSVLSTAYTTALNNYLAYLENLSLCGSGIP